MTTIVNQGLRRLSAAVFVCSVVIPGIKVPASTQSADESLQSLIARIPLPSAYHAVAIVYNDEDTDPSQKYEVWVSREWAVALQSLVQPGVGFFPFDYVHATSKETWRYSFQSLKAVRSSSFNDHHFVALETCTPLYLLRELSSSDTVVHEVVHNSDSGMTDVTVALARFPATMRAVVSVDAGGKIVTRKILNPDGKLVGEDRFKDWKEVADGAWVPMRVEQLFSPGEDGAFTSSRTLLFSDVSMIESRSPPDRIPVTSSFMIVDTIDNVTRRSDGTVLGPIEQGAPTSTANKSHGPAPTGLSSRTVVAIGVGLLLLAGGVIGFRRWKGA